MRSPSITGHVGEYGIWHNVFRSCLYPGAKIDGSGNETHQEDVAFRNGIFSR